MRSAIVSGLSDPNESVALLGRQAVQISRCWVQTEEERPSEQILIWPGQSTLMTRVRGLAEELHTANPESVVSVVIENQEGIAGVTCEKQYDDAFKIAASVAVIKASWGWEEVMPIVVRINEDEFPIYAKYDGNEWIAKDHL